MSEITQAFPHDVDAERGVISSLLLEPQAVRLICAGLEIGPEHFYLPAHGLVFGTACAVVDDGEPLDMLTLGTRLRDAQVLEKIGGPSFLQEIWFTVPSAAAVGAYIKTVREKYLRRRAIECAHELSTAAFSTLGDTLEIIGDAHGQIGKLLHQKSRRQTIKDVLQEIVDEVREGRDDTGLLPVPLNGLGALNLYRGDLLIISAPTSCGKTALAAQMALAVAKTGLRVALYPLEMAQKQVLKRAVAQIGGNNADFIRTLVRGGAETPAVKQAVAAFMASARVVGGFDMHMRDDLFRWDQIRADLRQEHTMRPFSFVMIDYLQLIQSRARHERRQLAIAEITQGAKLLAKELNCVLCIPSQVNADGGTREAQDAENDAAALVKIHGDKDDAGDVRPGRVSIWKQREGQRHVDLPLKFNGLMTRFERSDI